MTGVLGLASDADASRVLFVLAGLLTLMVAIPLVWAMATLRH